MAVYIHTILLLLLGNLLAISGIKVDGWMFWIIVLIFLGLFISYDIMQYHPEVKDEKKEEGEE